MKFGAQRQHASTRAPSTVQRYLAARVFRVLWIIGFLIGTSTHVADIVIGGINTYAEFPVALRLFWLSLTVLDPLVVALLMMRRRSGVVLGLVVILTDISVNWSVYLTIGGAEPVRRHQPDSICHPPRFDRAAPVEVAHRTKVERRAAATRVEDQ